MPRFSSNVMLCMSAITCAVDDGVHSPNGQAHITDARNYLNMALQDHYHRDRHEKAVMDALDDLIEKLIGIRP